MQCRSLPSHRTGKIGQLAPERPDWKVAADQGSGTWVPTWGPQSARAPAASATLVSTSYQQAGLS